MRTPAKIRTRTSLLSGVGPLRPLLPSTQRVLVRQALRGGQNAQPMSHAEDAFEQEAARTADTVMKDFSAAGNTLLPSCPRLLNCATGQDERGPASRSGTTSGQEAAANSAAAASRSGSQPLSEQTRDFFEPRFGADFSTVSIHHDSHAAHLAQSIGARAFACSNNIYFNQGEYQPGSDSGKHLLAHELTHVMQQQGAASGRAGTSGIAATPAPQSIQCENGGYQLSLGTGSRPWWQEPPEPQPQLRLDPQLEAEMALTRMRIAQQLLDPANVRSSLLQLDPALLAPSSPDWLRLPATPAPAPLVPAGAGPETPRAGTLGDVLRAITAIPAVDTALTTLQTQATQQVSSDWQRLSTGERVLLISQGVLISGAVLAGVFSNEQTRDLVLNQLQGRDLPIPGVPGLSFQFNLTGPDQRLFFTLDLGRLLWP